MASPYAGGVQSPSPAAAAHQQQQQNHSLAFRVMRLSRPSLQPDPAALLRFDPRDVFLPEDALTGTDASAAADFLHGLLHPPDGLVPARHHLLDGVAELVHAVDERDGARGVARVRGRRGLLGERGHVAERREEGLGGDDGAVDAGAQRARRHGLGLEVGGGRRRAGQQLG